jgi:ribosome-associated protein
LINVKKMAAVAAGAADSKNASDLVILNVNRLTSIADYFVICSAGSTPQLRAIADEVERLLAAEGERPIHIEGYSEANWILMDYGSVVVHVFRQETREFYSLEHLWADAPRVDIKDLS